MTTRDDNLDADAGHTSPHRPQGEQGEIVEGRKFAALANPDSRTYLITAALAMAADNMEHVITYWVLWELFQSEALVGFQVISHWLPFLLFSVWAGSLADRFDCRRVIQAGQALFIFVSLAWGVMFLTGTTTVWMACILLVLHGLAGALWHPAEQLMLHDFVGPRELPSAVRLNATFHSLGVLIGPVFGTILFVGLGPTLGIFVNALVYLPLTLFLFKTKYTGHTRAGAPSVRARNRNPWRVFKVVIDKPVLLSMTVLAAAVAMFTGSALGAAMPAFAEEMGVDAGPMYSLLLLATAAGAVLAGFLIEVTQRVPIRGITASVAALIYGVALLAFALSGRPVVGVILLFLAGAANMTSTSVAQTVVQLNAPGEVRGQVIGAYTMASNGLRFGSGVTVGVLGAALGIPGAIAIGAAAVTVSALLVTLWLLRRPV